MVDNFRFLNLGIAGPVAVVVQDSAVLHVSLRSGMFAGCSTLAIFKVLYKLLIPQCKLGPPMTQQWCDGMPSSHFKIELRPALAWHLPLPTAVNSYDHTCRSFYTIKIS